MCIVQAGCMLIARCRLLLCMQQLLLTSDDLSQGHYRYCEPKMAEFQIMVEAKCWASVQCVSSLLFCTWRYTFVIVQCSVHLQLSLKNLTARLCFRRLMNVEISRICSIYRKNYEVCLTPALLSPSQRASLFIYFSPVFYGLWFQSWIEMTHSEAFT